MPLFQGGPGYIPTLEAHGPGERGEVHEARRVGRGAGGPTLGGVRRRAERAPEQSAQDGLVHLEGAPGHHVPAEVLDGPHPAGLAHRRGPRGVVEQGTH